VRVVRRAAPPLLGPRLPLGAAGAPIVTAARCGDCGRFINRDYTEPELCDDCLDAAWARFTELVPLGWVE
jgi:hypothetical protein